MVLDTEQRAHFIFNDGWDDTYVHSRCRDSGFLFSYEIANRIGGAHIGQEFSAVSDGEWLHLAYVSQNSFVYVKSLLAPLQCRINWNTWNEYTPWRSDCYDTHKAVNSCGWDFNDTQGRLLTDFDMVNWCELTQQEFDSTSGQSDYWAVLIDASVLLDCDYAYFENQALSLPPPAAGRPTTVQQLYACDVPFTVGDYPNYELPEIDARTLSQYWDDVDWSCLDACLAGNPCSEPPTEIQTEALLACKEACQ